VEREFSHQSTQAVVVAGGRLQRLQHWTVAFNPSDAAGACDLFAPNLIATVPGRLGDNRMRYADDSLRFWRDEICEGMRLTTSQIISSIFLEVLTNYRTLDGADLKFRRFAWAR
jgi:hypothetical protein